MAARFAAPIATRVNRQPMRISAIAVLFAALVLQGCGTFVPIRKMSEVLPETLAKALEVRVFTIDNPNPPARFKAVGEITAYSCKPLLTDPPASKGDALKRLQVEAVLKGADAIINVTFDERGTDALGTNCWESVQASGLAVLIEE